MSINWNSYRQMSIDWNYYRQCLSTGILIDNVYRLEFLQTMSTDWNSYHTCDRVAMLQLEICKFLAGD
jgi:hypothetical protein